MATRYRVICPDLRGLGWTEAPAGGYRPDVMADDIIGLLDRLGVDRFRAMGHDWGGLVGYLLALRFPERVERYIALNTASPFLRPTPQVLASTVRLWHIAANAAPVAGSLAVAHATPDWALRHWIHRSDTMTGEDRGIFLAQFEEPARVHATVSYYRNLVTHEIPLLLAGQFRWQRLRVPTLVLAGDRDPLFPTSTMTEFGEYATDLQVCVLEEVGHFPTAEDPGRVVEEAMTFLR